MPKQNPDLMFIKIGDGADPEVFVTLCGLNSRNMTIDGETIDVTTVDCTGSGDKLFRQMMAGTSAMSVSGSGFFESKTQSVILVNSKMTGTAVLNLQIIVPGLGTFEGPFIIDSLGIAGELNGGAVTQELSFSSADTISFTAEV